MPRWLKVRLRPLRWWFLRRFRGVYLPARGERLFYAEPVICPVMLPDAYISVFHKLPDAAPAIFASKLRALDALRDFWVYPDEGKFVYPVRPFVAFSRNGKRGWITYVDWVSHV